MADGSYYTEQPDYETPPKSTLRLPGLGADFYRYLLAGGWYLHPATG